MYDKNLASELDAAAWPIPSVFKWLKKAGSMDNDEFARYVKTPLGVPKVMRLPTLLASTFRRFGHGCSLGLQSNGFLSIRSWDLH